MIKKDSKNVCSIHLSPTVWSHGRGVVAATSNLATQTAASEATLLADTYGTTITGAPIATRSIIKVGVRELGAKNSLNFFIDFSGIL